jgi:hypothetical protein
VPDESFSVDDFDREAIAAARRRSPSDKLREGLVLFDRTARIMTAGIRDERPDADAADQLRILRERLRLARLLERR